MVAKSSELLLGTAKKRIKKFAGKIPKGYWITSGQFLKGIG
jgi:hypothetical protein